MPKAQTALAEPLPLSATEREQSLAASRAVAVLRSRRDAGAAGRAYHRVTEPAWAKWIAKVREVGNAKHAAALAFGENAWRSADAFLDLCRRDPLRQREYDGAIAHFEARISRELIRRGIEGMDVARWHDGEVVGYTKEYDGKIALALASHHLRLIEKRQDSTVTVHHGADAADDVLFSLTWESVQRMPADIRKRLLAPLLEWVKADRAKLAGEASTIAEPEAPMIEDHSTDGASNPDAFNLDELAEIF
jgi:hypothetical protein